MRHNKLATTGISFLLLALPLNADDEPPIDKDDVYTLAQQFASCAGLYDALAQSVQDQIGNSAMVEQFKGMANGAQITAQYVAQQAIDTEKAKEFASNGRKTFSASWGLRVDPEPDKAAQQEMNICLELNPFQADVVERARKKAYGFN
ncbi:MAG: hypothetical protein HWE25_11610 [Alphaproteobacteria bacterium]|nr:hypothetical protein [Alphaproteobacteria bacterium]